MYRIMLHVAIFALCTIIDKLSVFVSSVQIIDTMYIFMIGACFHSSCRFLCSVRNETIHYTWNYTLCMKIYTVSIIIHQFYYCTLYIISYTLSAIIHCVRKQTVCHLRRNRFLFIYARANGILDIIPLDVAPTSII